MESADRERRVELVLGQVDRLPTLSPVAARLLAVAGDDDADIDEIVVLLESDPAMSATILGLCRRADLGLGDRITTVRHAVVMLGLETVRSVVLSVTVYELMRSRGDALDREAFGEEEAGDEFDRRGLWKHAVAVAVGGELIARERRELRVRPDLAFVSGLLADLGRLALELVLPRGYARVVRAAAANRCDSAPVEREIIGLDHHTAGHRLSERWGLPEAIREAIWLHGQAMASVPEVSNRTLVGIVTLAKAWARHQHLGWSADFGTPRPLGEVAREIGVDEDVLDRLAPKLVEAVADRCRVLGLDEQSEPELLLESVARANEQLSELNARLARRAAQADAQQAAIDSITTFLGAGEPGRSVSETLGRIVRSAGGVFGEGFYAAVYQAGPGEAWQVFQFSASGRLERSQTAEAPPEGASIGKLGSGVSMAALGVLPWLADYLADAADMRQVRVTPIVSAGSGEGAPRGPSAVLLHDADPRAAGVDGAAMAALVAAWSSSLQAAAHHEKDRRLGEQLAESNRRLGEMQRELTAKESMARLGEMAAGAAHEMNNPLTIIRGRSKLLGERVGTDRDRRAAEAIEAAATQLAGLISSLHLLAAPPRPRVEANDPILVVRGAIDAARAKARIASDSKSVRLDTTRAKGTILTDRDLVMRGLAEVIANAIEAAPGGIVEVDVQTDPSDGRWSVRVADNGPGLSERAMRHAFDPFFSEKPAGRQRGLGLSEARGLVELLGGHIDLSNAPGGGAVATVNFRPLTGIRHAA
ncbi:MAG: HDOD domain-containing protein [Phycisphaerales bacterium]